MIIPAAGLGSRLQTSLPKAIFPVNEKCMIDYLFELYSHLIDLFLVVLHPSFAKAVINHCSTYSFNIEYEFQERPTGMLDAILAPKNKIQTYQPESIWITWCDQIAVHPKTVNTLANIQNNNPDTALIFPTSKMANPYIHFERNDINEIMGVLQKREGNEMPETGESDMGLFCLSYECYSNMLVEFSNDVEKGTATQERNFLTFIPWLQGKAKVYTFPGHDKYESLGINTREDLYIVENYLSNQKR